MASSLWAGLRGITTVLLVLAVTAIGVRTYLQSYPIPLLGAGSGPRSSSTFNPAPVCRISAAAQERGGDPEPARLPGPGVSQGRHPPPARGEYEFTRQHSLFEVLGKLESGRVVTHQVTIPEGFTRAGDARLLAGERLVEGTVSSPLPTIPRFASRLGVPADRLEGYLYPDTYRLTRGMGKRKSCGSWWPRFRQLLPADFAERARRLGLDTHGATTLASLIEKEVRQDQEARHRGGGLSQPATAPDAPAIGPDGCLRHSRFPRPYPRRGSQAAVALQYLPDSRVAPGPIANPGRGSLTAAVNPAPVNYLYFVSKNDGTHFFSRTLEEHSDAIRRYQARGETATESES